MAGETSTTLLPPAAWRQLGASHPRHLVVADANALFQDTVRRAKDGFTAMSLLAEHGSITLLSASHVPAKAEQHLPRIAGEAGVAEGLVMETWRTVHEPMTRFVEVPASLCASDPRVAAVRDPEDVAFAQLAVAVGPSLLLTRDHHLHEAGIGTERWVEALILLGGLIELELAFFGGTRLALALAYLLADMTAQGARFLGRSPLMLGLAVGAAALLVTQDRESILRRARSARSSLTSAGGRLLDLAAPHLEPRIEARAHLGTQLVAPMSEPAAETICARALALSPAGLEATALTGPLRRGGHDLASPDLDAMLTEHASFTLDQGRWMLGG